MKQEKDIERMFRQHYEKMYNLARSILSDDDESKDVVSEVFTTILADDIVLMPESEEGFLMRSVRNQCLNQIAHKGVKEKVAKLLIDDTDVICRMKPMSDWSSCCFSSMTSNLPSESKSSACAISRKCLIKRWQTRWK